MAKIVFLTVQIHCPEKIQFEQIALIKIPHKRIKKEPFKALLLNGATNLPKLELFNIVYKLKDLLNEEFINDLKIQLEYLIAA